MDNNPKNVMFPHTEAKLKFFGEYIKRYLRIIIRSKYYSRINLFDLFCGTGIYKNGKEGSPIIAFEIIKNLKDELLKYTTEISMYVNDSDTRKVDNVKKIIESLNNENICNVEYHNDEFIDTLPQVLGKLNCYKYSTKNLLFIDPYGYKDIHKNHIEYLLENGKTEIVLFIPISHMHRFQGIAIKDYNNPKYIKLRDFIHEFFPSDHPIRIGKVSVKKFIRYIKDSLSYSNKYYTSSYFIQRDNSNFNALFFITPNIFGLEKIIEVKWELDPIDGSGFRKNLDSNQYQLDGFFDFKFANDIENLIKRGNIDNSELYRYTLINNYLPKHTNKVLKALQSENKINVFDIELNKEARKNSFYINYENYQKKKININFN
jgi:three-Cys-motif partner protein